MNQVYFIAIGKDYNIWFSFSDSQVDESKQVYGLYGL